MNRLHPYRSPFLVLCLALVFGCATRHDVQEIVQESNQLLEARELLVESSVGPLARPGVDDGEALDAEAVWPAIARIDAFLERHPDLTQATNALTVRKAVLLAFAGKPNMARAAFAAYREDGGNARDAALYRNSGVLLWWWSTSATTPNSSELVAARDELRRRIEELSSGIDATPADTDVHLYLATVRAHMRWKLSTLAEEGPEAELTRGLAEYCASFTPRQQALARAWMDEDLDALAAVPAADWRLIAQVESILNRYRESAPGAVPEAGCDWLAGGG